MMIPLDVVEGERILCVVNPYYAVSTGLRIPEIDWPLIRELRYLVDKLYDTRNLDWYVRELFMHFDDALDETLPEQRRMVHGDIAFSKMWNAFGPEPSIKGYPTLNPKFIGMALEAGLK